MSLTNDDKKDITQIVQNSLKPIKKSLEDIETKVDLLDVRVSSVESKVDTIQETLSDLTSATGAIFEWTDDIHRAFVGKSPKKLQEN